MGTEVIAAEENEIPKPADSQESSGKLSDLEEKIIRQIEYYFGNFNLSKDKFLRNEIKNDDGWVPLETLIKFNRLKQLTVDFNVISEALKKSPNQLLEVNEECTKIKRKVPPPESFDRAEVDDRTLYIKGFHKSTKLDEILEFFKGNKVENVMMRRKPTGKTRTFKGSVFATFETKEDAEAYLNKTGLKFGSTELLKETKKDYVKRKDIFYDNLRAEKEKKMSERQANIEKEMSGSHTEIIKGCLLGISGLGESNVTRFDIKNAAEKYGKVVYVDFFPQQNDAVVRFDTGIVPDFFKEIVEEDGEKKIEINSMKFKVILIEGEDEEKYWEKIAKNKAETRMRMRQEGYRPGNKGRFNKKQRGWKFNKRNKEDGNEDEPVAKRTKVEVKEENQPDGNEDEPVAKRSEVEVKEENQPDGDKEEPPAKRVKVEDKEKSQLGETAEVSN